MTAEVPATGLPTRDALDEADSFAALLARAQVGCQRSWAEIIGGCRGPMLEAIADVLRRYGASRPGVEPEEACQEACLRLIRAVQHGVVCSDEARFLHFALVIARNTTRKLMAHAAAAKRAGVRQAPLTAAQAADLISREPDPAERSAARDFFVAHVDHLPVCQDGWATACWLLGESPSEIAAGLRVPVHTVRRMIKRVLSRWRAQDDPESGENTPGIPTSRTSSTHVAGGGTPQ